MQTTFCLWPKAKFTKHLLLFAVTRTLVCTIILLITFKQQGQFDFNQLTTVKKLLPRGGVKIYKFDNNFDLTGDC